MIVTDSSSVTVSSTMFEYHSCNWPSTGLYKSKYLVLVVANDVATSKGYESQTCSPNPVKFYVC